MKKILYLTILTQLLLLLSPISRAQSNSKKKLIKIVAVLPTRIVGNVNVGTDFSSLIQNKISETLSGLNGYSVVDIGKNEEREKVKDYNECKVGECPAEVKSKGAEWMIQSELSSPEGHCRLTFKREILLTGDVKSKSKTSSCSVEDIETSVVTLVYEIIKTESVKSNGTRPIRINSNPQGAIVYIDGERLGVTPLETSSKTGVVKLRLEIEGTDKYQPYSKNETIEDLKEVKDFGIIDLATRDAILSLNVLPSEARLSAKIYIDDKEIENSAIEKIIVETEKSIQVVVEAANFSRYKKTISPLKPDQKLKLDIKLEANPCELNLSSNPSGAEVFLGEEKIGTTNYKDKISPGSSRYLVKKPFYNPVEVEIYCKPGEYVDKNINLKWVEYSDEDQQKIDRAANWRTYSYYGFALSAGLAYLSYSKVNEFKKYDDEYKNSTDPSVIESSKLKREDAKKSITMFTGASLLSLGASALMYKWGEFPQDVIKSTPVVFIPEKNGVQLVWQIQW